MSLLLLHSHGLVALKCNQILGVMRLLPYSRVVSVQTRRRATALPEVLGIYPAGAYLSDQIAKLLLQWRLISDANPFDLLRRFHEGCNR